MLCLVCECAGAWEWEYLEEAVAEKLKSPLAVAQLMERVRSFLGKEKVAVSHSQWVHPLPTDQMH